MGVFVVTRICYEININYISSNYSNFKLCVKGSHLFVQPYLSHVLLLFSKHKYVNPKDRPKDDASTYAFISSYGLISTALGTATSSKGKGSCDPDSNL